MPPLSDTPRAASREHVTGRTAVSSASTLLLALLLRLNHVLAPLIVALFRRRHNNWIERVTDDVEAELRRNPKSRQLCAGACCQVSYGTFAQRADDNTSQLTVLDWVQAVASSSRLDASTADEIAAAADFVEDVFTGDAKQGERPRSEAEIYFALRVQQEARHRRNRKLRVLDEQLVLIWLTVLGVVAYGAGIIVAVQYWYRLDVWELGVFSWSLLSTALFVEANVLRYAWRRLFVSDAAPEVVSRGTNASND
eukprot:TRINITY_DN50694_c0_g1_i1.p1 TRINITY_DN50694_c0_g1~~TRINITY_DN50694_c0_g1_i1.p1  ORF type:complete len:277 (-),score=59.32 TRINITY_DN50694_c0_g1_i1:60-818(-)